MTSLLPRSAVELQIDDGRPQLYSEAAGGDLCHRSYRWRLLEAVGAAPLGKDRTAARRDEIHHLWDMTEPPKSIPRVLGLFDHGVDEVGHGAGHEVLRHFEELLADLERAIRKLRSWGYAEVHVVTDHGFILLHSSANIQTMHIDTDRFALFGARVGLLKPGEQVAAAMVPFPLDPSWSVALPPGLRHPADFSKVALHCRRW